MPSDAAGDGTASASTSAAAQPNEGSLIARLRSQLRATPITVRWVALALVLVGGTALTVGASSYARARAALRTTAETRLQLAGRDVADGVHRKLMEHVVDITTWAHLETMVALTFGDVDKEVAELLRKTIAVDEAYAALAALDREGRYVAATGDLGALGAPTAAPASGATRLAVAGGGPKGPLRLRLETPVANPRRPEERIGTLVALLDPARLLANVAADRLEREAIGAVLAADGTPLAQAGASIDTRERVLAEDLPIAPLAGVEAPRFTIGVRQPARVALADVDALRRTLVRSALAVMLLSGIAGGLFAWRLSVPIRRLTASVQQVAARGQPEPIDGAPRGGGEVGVLADAFNAMLQRLVVAQRESLAQSRLALLGEIAASVVHDVRTPLSVLKTSAQLLGGATLSVAEQRDLAGLIASEVDRLNRVVTNLADLGRLPPQARRTQSVRQLIERTAAVLRPWAQARGVTFEIAGGADSRVHADPDQLLQGLLNVIHNAAQASPAGSRVHIGWDAEPPWVVIHVRDDGPGFSADALERVFSPFFTTKPDGTGLGLAITKRIVEAHDGTIDVGNDRRGGARVSLRLPLAA